MAKHKKEAQAMPVRRQNGGRAGHPHYVVEDPDGYDYLVIANLPSAGKAECVQHGEKCPHAAAVREKIAAK